MAGTRDYEQEPDQDFGDDGRENAVNEDALDDDLEDDLDGDEGAITAEDTTTIREGLE